MWQTSNSKYNIIYMLTISFLTIFFTLSIPFIYHPTPHSIPLRIPLIGSIFIMICSLGVLAIFTPKECSNIIYGKKRIESNLDAEKQHPYKDTFRIFKFKVTHGHHPQCQKFSEHEFHIGKRTFCAGCTGLLAGTIVSLTCSIGYFFNGWSLQNHNILLIDLGIICVTNGLLQFHLFRMRRNYHRAISNTFFILGMFLILIGIDSIIQSFQIDLFLIFMFIFWMAIRILLSRYNHDKICNTCGFACKK